MLYLVDYLKYIHNREACVNMATMLMPEYCGFINPGLPIQATACLILEMKLDLSRALILMR